MYLFHLFFKIITLGMYEMPTKTNKLNPKKESIAFIEVSQKWGVSYSKTYDSLKYIHNNYALSQKTIYGAGTIGEFLENIPFFFRPSWNFFSREKKKSAIANCKGRSSAFTLSFVVPFKALTLIRSRFRGVLDVHELVHSSRITSSYEAFASAKAEEAAKKKALEKAGGKKKKKDSPKTMEELIKEMEDESEDFLDNEF